MEDNTNNGKIGFCKVASATTAVTNIKNQNWAVLNNEDQIDQPFTNIQLAFWIDAKTKYFSLIKKTDYPDLSDMILIVIALGNSLTFLFAVNFEKINDSKTPELFDMIKKWGLHNARPDYFRDFEELFVFYRNLLKHPDRKKLDEIASILTKEKLKRFMQITRNIWIWFIKKYHEKHNSKVPGDQLKEFKEFDW
ncbi:MAG: hypothetical protein JXB88_03090 [Spirochaetales bacterium]|nr:hypothetical protein [Spirochaetales bacterium]